MNVLTFVCKHVHRLEFCESVHMFEFQACFFILQPVPPPETELGVRIALAGNQGKRWCQGEYFGGRGPLETQPTLLQKGQGRALCNSLSQSLQMPKFAIQPIDLHPIIFEPEASLQLLFGTGIAFSICACFLMPFLVWLMCLGQHCWLFFEQ